MPDAEAEVRAPADGELVACSLRDLVRYFLVLGTVGFGGPIALAGYMQRDLVERRRWISKQDYTEGLALAALAALVLGRRALFDAPTVAVCVATLLVLFRFKKIPEPLVILVAGVVGFAIVELRA